MATHTEEEIEDRRVSIPHLVTAAQAGDKAAFELLFARYHQYVESLASRYVDCWDDAEEICQEVFVVAMQRLHQLRVPAAFGSWLRQATHRTAINYCRRHRRMRATEPQDLDGNCGSEVNPLDTLAAAEARDAVHDGLRRLKPCDRETLVAFYLNDRSLLEMAEDFDAPLGTIKRRLHVARKRLAEELGMLQTA